MDRKTYKVYFIVNREKQGFYYTFDGIPSDDDLKTLIHRAIKEYIDDLKLEGTAEDIDYRECNQLVLL